MGVDDVDIDIITEKGSADNAEGEYAPVKMVVLDGIANNAAEPVNFTRDQSSCVDHLLGHIESQDNSNSMHFHATNHHCIHCKGTHTSEDHHLSVSIPPVFNSGHIGLWPPLEQAHSQL